MLGRWPAVGLISHHRRSTIARQVGMLDPALDHCLKGRDVPNPRLDHRPDVPQCSDGYWQQAHDM